ncbi:hypothetical protein AOLI_G00295500 [Acnodon oligacanthus]
MLTVRDVPGGFGVLGPKAFLQLSFSPAPQEQVNRRLSLPTCIPTKPASGAGFGSGNLRAPTDQRQQQESRGIMKLIHRFKHCCRLQSF